MKTANESVEIWVTEDQLGGPTYLNNPGHASILCKSGELDDRPHEYESLANEVACLKLSPEASGVSF